MERRPKKKELLGYLNAGGGKEGRKKIDGVYIRSFLNKLEGGRLGIKKQEMWGRTHRLDGVRGVLNIRSYLGRQFLLIFQKDISAGLLAEAIPGGEGGASDRKHRGARKI